jgi:hypothetical protein
MDLVCEFCNKKFSNKYNLKRHKENTNRCKKKQENNLEFNCIYCSKKYSTEKNRDKHYLTCTHKKNSHIEDLIKNNKNEIIKIKQEYENKLLQETEKIKKTYENKIKDLEEQVKNNDINYEIKLEENEKIYDEKIKEHVMEFQKEKMKLLEEYNLLLINNNNQKIVQNNTINNNYNITLIPFTKESIRTDEITIKDVKNGISGISDILLKSITMDKEKGVYNYICSDPSRNMYKYFSIEKKWVKDINGQYIKDIFYPTILPKFKELYLNYQKDKNAIQNGDNNIEEELQIANSIVKLDIKDRNLHLDVLNQIKGYIYSK